MRKLFYLSKFLTALLFPVLISFGMVSLSNAQGDAGYVGADVCKGCHEGYYDSYAGSVHAKKAIPGSPAGRHACESCHGPGAVHVEKGGGKGTGIFNFSRKLGAKEKAAKCLACHEETKHLAFWDLSRHKSAGVSCTDCHSIHAGGAEYLKAGQPEVCFGCHKDIRAQVNRQSHHPIWEGKVSCSDCHNPHGEFGPRMVKADTVNDLCYKCHPEKRGPFMWEHPPVEENCVNCHTPHGSNHNKLLVMKPPQLCQRCHDGAYHPGQPWTKFSSFISPATGAATTPDSRLVGRACLNCHTNIHGANGPSAYGQRFLR